jgi:hypothetical protein
MTLEQWRELAARVHGMADRIWVMRRNRVDAVCRANGLDIRCLHNAAGDDGLTGWCHQNPGRLKLAKALNRELSDWTPSRIAERICSRAWQRVVWSGGAG